MLSPFKIKNPQNTDLQRATDYVCGPTWARTRDHLIMSQSHYGFT